ncbi:MAG: YlbF family regulator [Planctomycetes bacterium]|nr:YlbF family regulator [Planctomycetota bacterium]
MLLEKARELGLALGQSKEFQELVGAERAFEASPGAVELATKVRAHTQAIRERQEKGQAVAPEEIEELRGLQQAVERNSVIQDLVRAQNGYDRLVTEVNQHVTGAIEKARTQPVS